MFFKPLPSFDLQLWVGAAKAVDGLFAIADNEHTAALLRGNFLHQRLQQPPLRRIGILKLVYQDMLDTRRQSVLYPVATVVRLG